MDTLKTINQINKVRAIDPIKAISQIQPIKSINRLQEVTDTVTSSLTDYNNPLEINSVVDALFNTEARKLKYGKASGTALRAVWDHMKEHAIDPMLRGDWSTTGMNALTGFSEDMDYFARPFKALTVGGSKAAEQDRAHNRSDYAGLIGNATGAATGAIVGGIIGSVFPVVGTSIGITLGGAVGGTAGTLIGSITGEIVDSSFVDNRKSTEGFVGRINYDYNTGSWFSDMALEIISDPTGWVDLATNIGSGVAYTAAKATAGSATKAASKIAKETGKSLTWSQRSFVSKTIKRTLKQTTKEAVVTSAKETVEDAAKKLIKNTRLFKKLANDPLADDTFKLISDVTLEQLQITDKTLKSFRRTRDILDSLDRISNGITFQPFKKSLTAPAYLRNYKIKAFGMDTSRGLMKLATLGNPISAAGYAATRVAKPLVGLSKEIKFGYLLKHTDGIDKETLEINMKKYAQVFKTAAIADAYARALTDVTESDPMNRLLENLTANTVDRIKNDISALFEKAQTDDVTKSYYYCQKIIEYFDRIFGEETSKLSTTELLEKIAQKFAIGDNLDILNKRLNEVTLNVMTIGDFLEANKQFIEAQEDLNIKTQKAVALENVHSKLQNPQASKLKNPLDNTKLFVEDFKALNNLMSNSDSAVLKSTSVLNTLEQANKRYYETQLNIIDSISKIQNASTVNERVDEYKKIARALMYNINRAEKKVTITELTLLLKSLAKETDQFTNFNISQLYNVLTTLRGKYKYNSMQFQSVCFFLSSVIDFDATLAGPAMKLITESRNAQALAQETVKKLRIVKQSIETNLEKNKNAVKLDDIIIAFKLEELTPESRQAAEKLVNGVKPLEPDEQGRYHIKLKELMFSTVKDTEDVYTVENILGAFDKLQPSGTAQDYTVSLNKQLNELQRKNKYGTASSKSESVTRIITMSEIDAQIDDTVSSINKLTQQTNLKPEIFEKNKQLYQNKLDKLYSLKNELETFETLKKQQAEIRTQKRLVKEPARLKELDTQDKQLQKTIEEKQKTLLIKENVFTSEETAEQTLIKNIQQYSTLISNPKRYSDFSDLDLPAFTILEEVFDTVKKDIGEGSDFATQHGIFNSFDEFYSYIIAPDISYNVGKSRLEDLIKVYEQSIETKYTTTNVAYFNIIKQLSQDEMLKRLAVVDAYYDIAYQFMDKSSDFSKLMQMSDRDLLAVFGELDLSKASDNVAVKVAADSIRIYFKDAKAISEKIIKLKNLHYSIEQYFKTVAQSLATVDDAAKASYIINNVMSNIQHLYWYSADQLLQCATVEDLNNLTKIFDNINTSLSSSAQSVSNTLEAVAERYSIDIGAAHTARDDTKATEQLFYKLKAESDAQKLHYDNPFVDPEKTINCFADTETYGVSSNTRFREIYIKTADTADTKGKELYLFFDVDEASYNAFDDAYKEKLLGLKPDAKGNFPIYEEWHDTYISKAIENSGSAPLSVDENLYKLYEFIKTNCVNANGIVDFSLIGYNNKYFDNERLYNLIQRAFNRKWGDIDTYDKRMYDALKALNEWFSPKGTQMYKSVDVLRDYYLPLQGIIQLNSNAQNQILEGIKRFASQFSETTRALSFNTYDAVTAYGNLGKQLTHIDPNSMYSNLSFFNNKLKELRDINANLTDTKNPIYVSLPSRYTVIRNGKEYTSLESAFINSAVEDGYSITSMSTKNIMNSTTDKFFNRGWDLSNAKRAKSPYRFSKRILKTADGYRYTGILYNPEVIAELKRIFELLKKDERVAKKIRFLDFMKPAADPVELMAQVHCMVPAKYVDMLNDTTGTVTNTAQEYIKFFSENEYTSSILRDIYEYGSLYRKTDTGIYYDFDKATTRHFHNQVNETANVAQFITRAAEDVDSLSNRRYMVTASQLAKMNEDSNQTYGLIQAVLNDKAAKATYEEQCGAYQDAIRRQTIERISDLDDTQLTTLYLQQGRVIVFQNDTDNTILQKLFKRLESNSNFVVVKQVTEDGDELVWTGLNKSVKSYYSMQTGKHRLTRFGKDLDPVDITFDIDTATYFHAEMKTNPKLRKLYDQQDYNITTYKRFIEDNAEESFTFNPHAVPNSEARYNKIFDKAPKEFTEQIPDKTVLLSPKSSDWRAPYGSSFNVIGDDMFKVRNFQLLDPKDYHAGYYEAVRTVIQKQTTKQQISNLFDSTLGYTTFNKFTKGPNGEEFDEAQARVLADFVSEHPEYKLCAKITYTNKSGKFVDKIVTIPNSEKSIMDAYNKGFSISLDTVQNVAVLMDTYNDKINNLAYNIVSMVLRLFKVSVLTSPGAVMRNTVDSYLKNVEELGVANATTYSYKAMVLRHRWYKCYKEIILNSQFELNFVNGNWWDNAVHLYFNGAERNGMDELLFSSLYEFFNEGPSSAILQDLELVKNYRTAYTFGTGEAVASVPNLKKWYNTNKKAINPKTFEQQASNFISKMFGTLIYPNVYVEQVNRLAMFLKYSDDGLLNVSQIYKRIADTHFDFTYKNNFHKMMELLIPFYSFTKDNVLFWLRVADNNPQFFKRIMDMLTPAMDLDDYSVEELRKNRSLVNQIRTGQIVIKPDADLTLKLNPSFLDVLNVFTNPVEALEQRLVSPAALALKHAEQFLVQNQYGGYEITNGDILNMIPVIGTVKVRAEAAKRNLERINKKPKLNDTQRLAAKPFAAISSTFGVTNRYPIYKYQTDRYYSTRSSQFYKNSTTSLGSSTIRSVRPKKLYYPMDKPTAYSSTYYKYLYIKSLQRYFNT